MDRLISENEVIKAICNYKGKFYTVHAISKIPSAYEGMTNGEIIKALFPNGKVLDKDECIGFEIIFDDGTSYCSFYDGIWWNSPYSEEGGDKE